MKVQGIPYYEWRARHSPADPHYDKVIAEVRVLMDPGGFLPAVVDVFTCRKCDDTWADYRKRKQEHKCTQEKVGAVSE